MPGPGLAPPVEVRDPVGGRGGPGSDHGPVPSGGLCLRFGRGETGNGDRYNCEGVLLQICHGRTSREQTA